MNRDERIYKLKNGSETAKWAAKEIERLEERIVELEEKIKLAVSLIDGDSLEDFAYEYRDLVRLLEPKS